MIIIVWVLGCDKFSKSSNQIINQEKHIVIFIENTPRLFKRVIFSTLGIKQSLNPGSYLGLPATVGRDKIFLFSYIEERTRLQVQGGKANSYLKWVKKFF